jgi:hypothetical protein
MVMRSGIKNPAHRTGFFILRIQVDPVVELKPKREKLAFFLSKFPVNLRVHKKHCQSKRPDHGRQVGVLEEPHYKVLEAHSPADLMQ